MTTLDTVTAEIVELHDFFAAWFNGSVDRDQLDPRFLSRLHPDFLFISPDGQMMNRAALRAGFDKGYGLNPDFHIAIRDVEVQYERENMVLATYTEWQRGTTGADMSDTARVTSVLMEVAGSVTWLHIHETWLPEAVRSAGSFDF